MSHLIDTFCEQLAFPCLFAQGKFSYSIERDVKLHPVKYCKQRLPNYTQMFITHPDKIFYVLSVKQQQKLNGHINVALTKVCSGRMTARMLLNKFLETVHALAAKDTAYKFMNSIKGTPEYWKKFLHEVVAMEK